MNTQVMMYRDWLRGPYQVRREAALHVSTRHSPIEAKLVRRSGIKSLEMTVPFGSRVALRNGPWTQVLWDGTRLQGDHDGTQTLRIALDAPTLWCEVRTASGSRDWVTYGGSALVLGAGRTVLGALRGLLDQRRAIALALVVHSLLLLMTWEGLWRQGGDDVAELATPIEMAAMPETTPDTAAPQPTAAQVSDADAFSGSFDRAFSRLDKLAKVARPSAAAKVSSSGSGWKGLFSGFRSAPVGAPQIRAAQKAGAPALSSVDGEILSELIRRNQERTRACYERAMLVDETLAVGVQYESDIVASGAGARLGSGRYAMKGDGSAAARQSLSRCLDQVLGAAELPARFRGVTLRYQFMFKS